MTRTARNSNFELLRIVTMMLIIMHHFLLAGGDVNYRTGGSPWGETLNGFAVVGVNGFILISGYFGIRFKWKKVMYLLYAIAFVCMTDYVLNLVSTRFFNFDYAWRTIVPFTAKTNWFVPTYIALMFFSPLLNGGLQSLERRNLTGLVIGLTCLNVYAYTFSIRAINATGYSLVQFFYLYIVGYWLREYKVKTKVIPVISYVVLGVGIGLWARYIAPGFSAFAYNNPLVLAASIALFLFFKGLTIQKQWINAIAAATFTVFLFHYVVLMYVKSGIPVGERITLYFIVFLAAYPLHLLIDGSWEYISKRMVIEKKR